MTYPQRLGPCIDAGSHTFRDSRPPAGDYGQLVIYCTRCGSTKSELVIAASRTAQ